MAKAKTQKQGAEQKPAERPAHWFKPGQSGNPGGKPVGTRNKLQGDFMAALSEDFAEHGRDAIRDCREQKPDQYLRVVASLMPKELELKRPLQDLTDDELDGAIALLRERLGTARETGAGTGAASSRNKAH